MKRDPFEQYFKHPDRKAKLYLLLSGATILATITITIGTILFILALFGVF